MQLAIKSISFYGFDSEENIFLYEAFNFFAVFFQCFFGYSCFVETADVYVLTGRKFSYYTFASQVVFLRESGLNRIHSGFETGSDNVLKLINKGLTQAQQIDAGRKAKEAGIELSVYFMPGIGGVEFSDENARETAHVINQIAPDYVRFRTFVLKYESEMLDLLRSGEFEECTDIQKLREIRNLIADVTAPDVTIVSDHIVNLIGSLQGRIGTDKEKMLAQADREVVGEATSYTFTKKSFGAALELRFETLVQQKESIESIEQ